MTHPSLSSSDSLAEQITEILRLEILSGELKPEYIIEESAIAARHNVSVSLVTKAISTLLNEALIVEQDNQFKVISLNEKDFLEIWDLRSALESMAARRAAPRWTQEDSDIIWGIIRRQYDAQSLSELSELDVELHSYMVQRSNNRRLFTAWKQVRIQFSLLINRTHRVIGAIDLNPMKGAAEAHAELLAAFETHNGDEAAAAAVAHVETWADWLSKKLEY
ncbi:MAG: GntR family transcriptional regulator [Verrucomicrobiota bacterium]